MIIKYLKASIAELHNVTWPTRKRGIRISAVVLIFMIASAVVLGFMDQLFAWGIRKLMEL